MSNAEEWIPNPNTSPAAANGPPAIADSPAHTYLKALERYEGFRLVQIHRDLGSTDTSTKPRLIAGQISERLSDTRFAERLLANLEHGSRKALNLFALTERAAWPLSGLYHALECLALDPQPAIRRLVELGVVAFESQSGGPGSDLLALIRQDSTRDVQIIAHPVVLGASRTEIPDTNLPAIATTVRQIRESDGLEPILRMAAVWQRVNEAPLRRTQQGTLYKRDRDRLEDDPVIAGPIADFIEPLPDMAQLWLALARGVGLLIDEPQSDRIVAAPPAFWAENAYHLPQMIATRWLGLRSWHEQAGMQHEESDVELALPYVRPAVLLWLATVPEDNWVALDDFAAHLRSIAPNWDRPAFLGESSAKTVVRGKTTRGKTESRGPDGSADLSVLESLLLGAAYQFGLVRTAEEVPSGRRLVQLSALGRYILALGPSPGPRPAYEHFLFVQPNFEMIAYRQGLSPSSIGQLSRFAHWSRVGAALEMKLTPESVYRGLEGGLTPQEMLERLARHSPRALPASVTEALRTWAGRRERVTYYASTTLIEFATRAELDQALAIWPADSRVPPVVISDRLVLVEDESTIPFQRFRMTGARDYRRAPEACLQIEPDGVTMALDLGRSDLLVDAELTRFADELPQEPARGSPGNPKRRFLVSKNSLARGAEQGVATAHLSHWYLRRTGEDLPPAVRLLLMAADSRAPALATSRPLVLHTPTSALLDGLLQHPDTRTHLGERLGPTSVIIPDEQLSAFRLAVERLGLVLPKPAPSIPTQ